MNYFGEVSDERCQQCDLCESPATPIGSNEKLKRAILSQLALSPMTLKALVDQLDPGNQNKLPLIVQDMLEQGSLMYDDLGRITLPTTSV